jgi:hypothetical protein
VLLTTQLGALLAAQAEGAGQIAKVGVAVKEEAAGAEVRLLLAPLLVEVLAVVLMAAWAAPEQQRPPASAINHGDTHGIGADDKVHTMLTLTWS